MSELSTTHHCSTIVQEANISPKHFPKAESDATLQYPSASAQSKEGRELQIASPPESKVQLADSGKDGRVGVAPPLGEHEKYHVFFCYSSADAPWVKAMIQKIESDEYGFKCCIHERDFIPGDSVINNIARSIQESQTTVFVLSRDFVDSKWCEFERQLVMSENLTEKNRKIIPVMLHECVLLPDFLRHMTYLKEWTPYFFDRFISALKDGPGSGHDPLSTFSYNPNYINGQHVLRIEPEHTWEQPCCRFDDQILHAKLMSRGVRIGREDAVTVIRKVMRTRKMEKFNWYYTKYGHLYMLAEMMSLVILIILIANHKSIFNDGDYSSFKLVASLVKFHVPLVLGTAIRYFIGRYIMNRNMERTMVEVNTILAKYHIFATVTDRYLGIAKAGLHFVYYERGCCLLQIQQDLMAMATQKSASVEVNIQGSFSDPLEPERAPCSAVCVEMPCTAPLLSEESGKSDAPDTDVHESSSSCMSDLRAKADALLMKYSELYARRLVAKMHIVPRESRGHTQYGACLCQLVEIYEFGWKPDFILTCAKEFSRTYTRMYNRSSGGAAVVADIMAEMALVVFDVDIPNHARTC